MLLHSLIEGLGIRLLSGPDATRICDLTEDSRTVLPGSLFIARRGGNSDGRAFIPHAIDAGAVAILTDDATCDTSVGEGVSVLFDPNLSIAISRLAERFYGSPSSRLSLIGVTGTNGKTTITSLIHQMLNGVGHRCGMMGTICIDDGVETAPASLTTPMAPEISFTLSRMVESGCRTGVMEVSSHALDQHRVGALRFAAAIFTNLSGDHLDYHGTMASYAAAKSLLFKPPLLDERCVAIVNAEDPASLTMTEKCKARILRCRIGDAADNTECGATIEGTERGATRATLRGPWGSIACRIPLVGRHNIMNSLQAFAACHAVSGMPAETLARQLGHAHAPPGRLEPVASSRDDVQVFVDYAHSDDSLRTALAVMTSIRDGGAGSASGSGRASITVVFGCGGDRDKTKRPRMGLVASHLADQIFITSDNPRSEDPGQIIQEILAGVPADRRGNITVIPDREAAIHKSIAESAPGDIILIAGKGHEDYQIVRGAGGHLIRNHFDDRDVARAALQRRRDRAIDDIEGTDARAAATGARREHT